MRVLFLDIDGVLNSVKTCVATGGYPFTLDEPEGFDWIAIKLLQRLCDSSGVQIVLSSTWRLHYSPKEVGDFLGLPVIDKTPSHFEDWSEELPLESFTQRATRGKEIAAWLQDHPEVTKYCIIDDDSDMLESQIPFFVKTDGFEGMSWKDFCKVCEILGEAPYAGQARDREWLNRLSRVENSGGWMV